MAIKYISKNLKKCVKYFGIIPIYNTSKSLLTTRMGRETISYYIIGMDANVYSRRNYYDSTTQHDSVKR